MSAGLFCRWTISLDDDEDDDDDAELCLDTNVLAIYTSELRHDSRCLYQFFS